MKPSKSSMLIAHASEQLDALEPAFVHAVGMAARSGAAVSSIHVQRGLGSEPLPPSAATLLARWHMPSSGIEQRWLTPEPAEDVTDALLAAIEPLAPDLLVLYTHARSGLLRLFAGSIAEGVARNLVQPTLLLPPDTGFVNPETGAVTLRRALLIAGTSGDAQRDLDALAKLVALCAIERCAVDLLHVDDGTPPPQVQRAAGLMVTPRAARGSIESAAASFAEHSAPDVVVMASRGHDQWSDVVWSSHTERVLHLVRRPLLWVPA